MGKEKIGGTILENNAQRKKTNAEKTGGIKCRGGKNGGSRGLKRLGRSRTRLWGG